MTTVNEIFFNNNYEIFQTKGAYNILKYNHPQEFEEITNALANFILYKSDIYKSGGNKSDITKRISYPFKVLGWSDEINVNTSHTLRLIQKAKTKNPIILDEQELFGSSHQIDFYKSSVGLEIQWNSKDGVFTRDLAAFNMMYHADAIGVAVFITRSSKLERLFKSLGVNSKYGQSTTHLDKLKGHLSNSANSCPILAIGISDNLYQHI